MKIRTRILTIATLLLFAGSILSVIPAMATVGGSFQILTPDLVAPGGPVQLDVTALTATGGTVYFYASLDDDPVISSGDIYFASYKTADLVDDSPITVFLPTSIPANEDGYHIKAVDIKQVGKDCVVTGETVEVLAEYPKVTIDEATGNVEDEPEISVEDADDYDNAYLDWKKIDSDYQGGPYAIVDGEVTVDTWVVPHAYKGTYKIVVWLEEVGGDIFATYVEFTIEPDVTWITPADLSIEADELDQVFTIAGTGFPEGTVAEDSIVVTLKDFMTGSTKESYDTRHDEVDVSDTDPTEGDLDIDVTVDAVEAGIVDVKITVDSTAETFTGAFYSSAPTDEVDFTSIKYYKISDAEGYNGDDVTFSFINLPGLATVTIKWIGATVSPEIATDLSDANGAYEYEWEIADLPGDTYQVRAIVTIGATTRERTIASFKILPKFEVRDPADPEEVLDETEVEGLVNLWGSGFPADAVIQTYWFGDEDTDFDPEEEVGATGSFEVLGVEVPHVSGGGLDVVVKIEGEDADGADISAETSIVINPVLIGADVDDYDVGVLAWDDVEGEWAFLDWEIYPMYPGHVVKVVGYGFKAGEEVGLKVYDEDDKLIGSATIGDGAKAQGDGDVELVAWLPNAKVLFPAGKPDCYWTVSGSTSSNNADSDAFPFAACDDGAALLVLGLANDGDVDNEVKVGDTLRAVGMGFRTKELTISIAETEDDLKTVSMVNGYFDTSFTIPELEGAIDGEDYTALIDLDIDIEDIFWVEPYLELTPAKGYTDATFIAKGTGFNDLQDIDLTWKGVVENEVLDTVDADDIEDGTFTIELTVPTVMPMQYKVLANTADDDELVWDDAAFTVLDEAAAQQNKTLNEILAQLKALDIATLQSKVVEAASKADAAKAAADAAKTAADTATSTANSAKTAADGAKAASDAAKAAADAAGSKADAAKAAADAAKTAADTASSSANSLTTLVYVAIGASVIAAIAAIVAVMQITKSIKG